VHARISSILRNAAEMGVERLAPAQVDVGELGHPRERELLKALADLPQVVASAAELREPHRVARYLEETVAPAYHRFYDACQVLPRGDDEVTPLTHARLLLCDATRIVVANALALLGVSAPERM
jgi:arginyl-tRNA synthetase